MDPPQPALRKGLVAEPQQDWNGLQPNALAQAAHPQAQAAHPQAQPADSQARPAADSQCRAEPATWLPMDPAAGNAALWQYLNSSERREPVIGLSMMTEYRWPDNHVRNCFCCHCCMDYLLSANYMCHLISASHRYNYIKMVYPHMVNDWPPRAHPNGRPGVLRALAQEVEGEEGWGRLRVTEMKRPSTSQSQNATAKSPLKARSLFTFKFKTTAVDLKTQEDHERNIISKSVAELTELSKSTGLATSSATPTMFKSTATISKPTMPTTASKPSATPAQEALWEILEAPFEAGADSKALGRAATISSVTSAISDSTGAKSHLTETTCSATISRTTVNSKPTAHMPVLTPPMFKSTTISECTTSTTTSKTSTTVCHSAILMPKAATISSATSAISNSTGAKSYLTQTTSNATKIISRTTANSKPTAHMPILTPPMFKSTTISECTTSSTTSKTSTTVCHSAILMPKPTATFPNTAPFSSKSVATISKSTGAAASKATSTPGEASATVCHAVTLLPKPTTTISNTTPDISKPSSSTTTSKQGCNFSEALWEDLWAGFEAALEAPCSAGKAVTTPTVTEACDTVASPQNEVSSNGTETTWKMSTKHKETSVTATKTHTTSTICQTTKAGSMTGRVHTAGDDATQKRCKPFILPSPATAMSPASAHESSPAQMSESTRRVDSKTTGPAVGLNFLVRVMYDKRLAIYCQLCEVKVDRKNHRFGFRHRSNYARFKRPDILPSDLSAMSEMELQTMVADLAKKETSKSKTQMVTMNSEREYEELTKAQVPEALAKIKAILRQQRESQDSTSHHPDGNKPDPLATDSQSSLKHTLPPDTQSNNPLGSQDPRLQPVPSRDPRLQPGASRDPRLQPGARRNAGTQPVAYLVSRPKPVAPWDTRTQQVSTGNAIHPVAPPDATTQQVAPLNSRTQAVAPPDRRTHPGAPLHPNTLPVVPQNNGTQPVANLDSRTQPDPKLQPEAHLDPKLQPVAPLHLKTQPGAPLLPKQQPGAPLHAKTQPAQLGAPQHPKPQPGAPLNPKPLPEAPLHFKTQPWSPLLPKTQLAQPGPPLHHYTQPVQPGAPLDPKPRPGAPPHPNTQPLQPGAPLHPKTQPGPPLDPKPQPGAPLHPKTKLAQLGAPLDPKTQPAQPGHPLYPKHQPGAPPHPETQPGAPPHPETQPGAPPHPETQPGAPLHPETQPAQPGPPLDPKTQSGAPLHSNTQSGAPLHPKTQSGAPLHPKTQAPLDLRTQPVTPLDATTKAMSPPNCSTPPAAPPEASKPPVVPQPSVTEQGGPQDPREWQHSPEDPGTKQKVPQDPGTKQQAPQDRGTPALAPQSSGTSQKAAQHPGIQPQNPEQREGRRIKPEQTEKPLDYRWTFLDLQPVVHQSSSAVKSRVSYYLTVKLSEAERKQVVGLSSVLECLCGENTTDTERLFPFYMCRSCQETVQLKHICGHIISTDHQLKYMSKNPDLLAVWNERMEVIKAAMDRVTQREQDPLYGMDAEVIMLDKNSYHRVQAVPFSEGIHILEDILKQKNVTASCPPADQQPPDQQSSQDPPHTEESSRPKETDKSRDKEVMDNKGSVRLKKSLIDTTRFKSAIDTSRFKSATVKTEPIPEPLTTLDSKLRVTIKQDIKKEVKREDHTHSCLPAHTDMKKAVKHCLDYTSWIGDGEMFKRRGIEMKKAVKHGLDDASSNGDGEPAKRRRTSKSPHVARGTCDDGRSGPRLSVSSAAVQCPSPPKQETRQRPTVLKQGPGVKVETSDCTTSQNLVARGKGKVETIQRPTSQTQVTSTKVEATSAPATLASQAPHCEPSQTHPRPRLQLVLNSLKKLAHSSHSTPESSPTQPAPAATADKSTTPWLIDNILAKREPQPVPRSAPSGAKRASPPLKLTSVIAAVPLSLRANKDWPTGEPIKGKKLRAILPKQSGKNVSPSQASPYKAIAVDAMTSTSIQTSIGLVKPRRQTDSESRMPISKPDQSVDALNWKRSSQKPADDGASSGNRQLTPESRADCVAGDERFLEGHCKAADPASGASNPQLGCGLGIGVGETSTAPAAGINPNAAQALEASFYNTMASLNMGVGPYMGGFVTVGCHPNPAGQQFAGPDYSINQPSVSMAPSDSLPAAGYYGNPVYPYGQVDQNPYFTHGYPYGAGTQGYYVALGYPYGAGAPNSYFTHAAYPFGTAGPVGFPGVFMQAPPPQQGAGQDVASGGTCNATSPPAEAWPDMQRQQQPQ